MFGVTMHATRGNKPVKVELFAAFFSGVHCAKKLGILKEFAVSNIFRNFGEVLVNDTACADVEVTYLAVTHLTVGKTYGHTACAKLCGRVIFL